MEGFLNHQIKFNIVRMHLSFWVCALFLKEACCGTNWVIPQKRFSSTSIQEAHATVEPAHLAGMAALRTCPQSSEGDPHMCLWWQMSLMLGGALRSAFSFPIPMLGHSPTLHPASWWLTLCFLSVDLKKKEISSYFFSKKRIHLRSTMNCSLGSATMVSPVQVLSKNGENSLQRG